MTYAIAFVILAALAFVLARRGKRPSAGAVNGWRINWSRGLPTAPTPQGEGWVIDVPAGASLHYVQRYGSSLREGQSLTLRLRVTGQFVASEYPDKPATATIMLQRKGDNGSAAGVFETYRQFSGEMIPLLDGEYILEVPITVETMGDVFGGHDPKLLEEAVNDAENIGIGFGGPGGRAHSVYSATPARFHLTALSYQPRS